MYQIQCAANPAKEACTYTCYCTGHTKVYPNQPCVCAEYKERAV